ncbi:MAG: polysaccharide biosynthesis tyrosine autokinase [Jatrophihabitantaceae bacterium]
MTLRGYLRILREQWWLVALMTVAAIAVAVAITALTSDEYSADARVLVSASGTYDPLAQAQTIAYVQTQVQTYANVISSPDVLHAVQKDLNLQISDSDLKSKLSASVPTAESIIDVKATDGSPAVAAAIANSAATALVAAVQKYSTSARLFPIGPATAPSSPDSPQPVLNIALGLLVGLLVGIALAVTRDLLDNRVKDPEVLSRAAGSPAMGVVVEDSRTNEHVIATRAGPRNVRAENFRQMRANLQFANVDEHPRVIAVASSIPGEGKTTVAINLASTLAEAGFTVCLVDADLRRPTIAKVLGLLSPVGLTSVLVHQVDLGEALQSAGPGLFVLTSGPTPPNPSEVLSSSYVRDVVRSLLDRVDYVVLDTAPLLPVADGFEVAALADGTLLVARQGVTTDTQVKRAASGLRRVDAKILGVVLNRVTHRRNDEYGYTYYAAEEKKPSRSRRGVKTK